MPAHLWTRTNPFPAEFPKQRLVRISTEANSSQGLPISGQHVGGVSPGSPRKRDRPCMVKIVFARSVSSEAIQPVHPPQHCFVPLAKTAAATICGAVTTVEAVDSKGSRYSMASHDLTAAALIIRSQKSGVNDECANMFSPPIARQKTKSAELQRVPVVSQRHGQPALSPVQLLQRRIGAFRGHAAKTQNRRRQ
jgi:hypothetical protein